MRKTLLATVVLSALAVPAMADSSVTIYGQANAALVYNANGSKDTGTNGKVNQWKVDAGNALETPSRLGFKGTGELGGGLNAFFQVETTVFMDNGADNGGTKLGDREAWVGLQSSDWGKLELGHGKTPYVNLADIEDGLVSGANNLAIYNETVSGNNNNAYVLGSSVAYGATTAANKFNAAPAIDANGLITKRPSNSLRYDSPDFDGFKFAAYLGLGENKTATTQETTYFSLGANYTNGPFFVGAAYQSDDHLYSAAAANAKSSSFLMVGTVTVDAFKFGLGGQSATQNYSGNEAKQLAFEGFATYSVGPALLKAGVINFSNAKYNGASLGNTGDLRYMVGMNYAFSKSTFAFVEFAGDSNKGKMVTLDKAQPAGTVVNAPSPTALSIGVSYAF